MSKVIATKRDNEGRIIAYKTDDGKILNHNECISAIESGNVDGLQIFTNRQGEQSIKSKRGEENYSLKNLPQF